MTAVRQFIEGKLRRPSERESHAFVAVASRQLIRRALVTVREEPTKSLALDVEPVSEALGAYGVAVGKESACPCIDGVTPASRGRRFGEPSSVEIDCATEDAQRGGLDVKRRPACVPETHHHLAQRVARLFLGALAPEQ